MLAAELAGAAGGGGASGFNAWQDFREGAFNQIVMAHIGRIARSGGTEFVIEFSDADAALACALALQGEAGALKFRTGISWGVVSGVDERMGGAGVQAAIQLRTLAAPGEVCVSAAVRDRARAKTATGLVAGGFEKLPGSVAPVQVWRHRPGDESGIARAAPATEKAATPPRAGKRGRVPILVAAGLVVLIAGGTLALWRPWATFAPGAVDGPAGRRHTRARRCGARGPGAD